MSVLSIFATLGASALSATLGLGGGYVLLCVISTILEIVVAVSIGMLLFGRKKIGLYLFIAVAAIGFVINLITYGMLGTLGFGNIFKSLLSAIIAPAITFFLAKIQERSSVLAAECASALLTSSSAHSCNPPEAFISVGGLYPPLRLICFISPLIEVGVSPTEMISKTVLLHS